MTGLQGNFMLEFLACFGVGMASNSVAMALGCAVTNVKDVTEISPLLFVPQVLFAGFFVRTNSIPIFLRWAEWLCSIKYGMNLALLLEFGPSVPHCNTSPAAVANCHN
eukprot:gene10014-12702_t